jgi:hypothetical protein
MSAKLNIQGAIETYNAKKISRGKSPMERQSFGGSDNIKAQKKSRILKKTGLLYKRGDGPINFNWNPRYFILDGTTLFYYTDASDKVCRGMTKLIEAIISPVERFEVLAQLKSSFNKLFLGQRIYLYNNSIFSSKDFSSKRRNQRGN